MQHMPILTNAARESTVLQQPKVGHDQDSLSSGYGHGPPPKNAGIHQNGDMSPLNWLMIMPESSTHNGNKSHIL